MKIISLNEWIAFIVFVIEYSLAVRWLCAKLFCATCQRQTVGIDPNYKVCACS